MMGRDAAGPGSLRAPGHRGTGLGWRMTARSREAGNEDHPMQPVNFEVSRTTIAAIDS